MNKLITGLFPAEARVHYSPALPVSACLLPAEQACTGGMVEKRLAEFTHGRHCARAAIELLGLTAQAIGKGKKRQPIWQAGIVGSISHTSGVAAAVAARANQLVAIGLDIEDSEPLSPKLMDMICLPEENPGRNGARAKLLFSIKEAIYKCLYPLVNDYIDFLDIQVLLDESGESYSVLSQSAKVTTELAGSIRGRYAQHPSYIISSAWVKAG